MKTPFNLSTKKDLELFINNENFKKIFILVGKKSYKLSGINKTLEKLLEKKTIKFYFKQSSFPECFINSISEKLASFSYRGCCLIIFALDLVNSASNNQNLKNSGKSFSRISFMNRSILSKN